MKFSQLSTQRPRKDPSREIYPAAPGQDWFRWLPEDHAWFRKHPDYETERARYGVISRTRPLTASERPLLADYEGRLLPNEPITMHMEMSLDGPDCIHWQAVTASGVEVSCGVGMLPSFCLAMFNS